MEGIVYSLEAPGVEAIYVGFTTLPPEERLAIHVCDYWRSKRRGRGCSSRRLFDLAVAAGRSPSDVRIYWQANVEGEHIDLREAEQAILEQARELFPGRVVNRNDAVHTRARRLAINQASDRRIAADPVRLAQKRAQVKAWSSSRTVAACGKDVCKGSKTPHEARCEACQTLLAKSDDSE